MVAFAELLNRLFDTQRRPDGKEYTHHEISKATQGALSPTYLAKLRTGQITNPGWDRVQLLCKFFRVPASYFFPDLAAFTPAEDQSSPEEQLQAAFRAMGVPSDVQAYLVGVAKAFQQQQHKKEGE